jgi:hypothetical protein
MIVFENSTNMLREEWREKSMNVLDDFELQTSIGNGD